MVTSLPGLERMSDCRADQSPTALPSNATILSPPLSPAALAGAASSLAAHLERFSLCWMTQSETLPTVVVWVCTPNVIITPRKIATARIRFMNGPANITITRFHGLRV